MKRHILIVEDNPGDVRLIQEYLSKDDFEVSVSGTLKECIEWLKTKIPDLILLDLGLPDEQGQKTFESVHSSTTAPIVVLTGLNDRDIAISAIRAGAQDYCVKGDMDEARLLNTINFAIERHSVVHNMEKLNSMLQDQIQKIKQLLEKE